MISLYFHIPFCTRKCPYCHFYVVPNQARHRALLADALLLEWKKNLPLLEGKKIVSVYFGGGTPTLFGPDQLAPLLERIGRISGEITIEANPEEADVVLLREYRKLGINRLSLGVQSLDDRSLQTLERIHSAKKAKEALWNAQEAGFDNVSIDLMYDLPGQTEASWEETLQQLGALPFHHLSLYNLTIEPHTPFHKRGVQPAGGEKSLFFLQRALERFQQIGLERYEISAFAREGKQAEHNKGYWTGRPFLGFGPSAFSYWEKERYRNVPNLLRYAKRLKQEDSPVDFRERLSDEAREKELFVIRLRLSEGAELPAAVSEQTLHRLEEQGLLQQNKNRVTLTERGMLFYDTIATELI